MNENVKAICLQIAELALETKDVFVNITSAGISIHHFNYENNETLYYEDISFINEKNAEQRIEKALDYIRSLGGNHGV